MLRRIFVHSADLVDGLQLEYALPGIGRGLTRFAGGVGGGRQIFDVPDGQELRAISGSYGRFVHSLRFHTDQCESREYGRPCGERFLYQFGADFRFRGIFGREGLYLDALGVILEHAGGPVIESGWAEPRSLGAIRASFAWEGGGRLSEPEKGRIAA